MRFSSGFLRVEIIFIYLVITDSKCSEGYKGHAFSSKSEIQHEDVFYVICE